MKSPGRPFSKVKSLVREGWNQRSYLYRPEGARMDGTEHANREYEQWLSPILTQLPRGSHVLDLGCGAGVPAARLLARRFEVTGVDISDVQIERARALVPRATFVREDMTRVRFPAGSFAAVVALYSIIHVPLAEQRPLFRRIHRWLVPGGVFLTILGAGRWKGLEKGWLGSDSWMFWDHEDATTYRAWLEEAGFVVDAEKFIPEGEGGHELFQVHRPRGPTRGSTRASPATARRAVQNGRTKHPGPRSP